MYFDQSSAVGDVAWAPYSSTVFACVTYNKTCPVYDLHVEKHDCKIFKIFSFLRAESGG